MKKIKLLLALPLIIAFLVLARTSFAQSPSAPIIVNPLFDMSKPAETNFIQFGETTPKTISIYPFTTVIIPPNSFKDSVTVNIFNGNWNKLKAVLPKDESPISSYYLVFVDSKGRSVNPSNPITIQSYNNYINTDTFFYPIGSVGNIDVANSKRWTGHIMVNTELPIQDSAFIVAANKILQQNDMSLHPVAPSGNATAAQTSGPSLYTQKVAALVFLIVVALLLLALLFNNNKKARSKRGK